jgi:hypothetical protein
VIPEHGQHRDCAEALYVREELAVAWALAGIGVGDRRSSWSRRGRDTLRSSAAGGMKPGWRNETGRSIDA